MSRRRHDRLLAALIAKLPAPQTEWPRGERIAWLRMMAMALDVVYGSCGAVRIAIEEPGEAHPAGSNGPNAGLPMPTTNPGTVNGGPRFYIDRDGFAMVDGRPIAIDDLPASTILWDERTGVELGDVAAILWRDIGTTRRSLPPGVALRPAT